MGDRPGRAGRRPMAAFCIPGLILSLCLSMSPAAATENPKEQYQKIQKELELHKGKLEETKRREHSVLEEIDGMNRRLQSVEADLRRHRERLRQTEGEIRRVEAEMAEHRTSLDRKKTWMKRKLRVMQRYGPSYELFVLLAAADDMAEVMRRWKYLEVITLQDRRTIDAFIGAIRGLEEKERQLRDLRTELQRQEEKVRLTERTIQEKKKEREVLLTAVRSEKSSYEKMLRELQEASRRLRDVLKKLEEKDTYEARGFPGLKGRLSWPVSGKVAVPYGSQKDPRFNTPVFRNGVYIKAEEEQVRSVHGGKVVFADWFKGYGNLLILNHGEGYHTLYANLAEIFFKVGDIIKIHDVVGRAGESGILNAPSLYFEIRYKGKPLDPMQWLKRR